MPPRNSELPEGTDHIINGAAGSSGSAGGVTDSGQSSQGAVSVSGGDGGSTSSAGSAGGSSGSDGRGSGSTREKLTGQVREQVSTLKGQAADKVRLLADDGKGRATSLLDEFSAVIDDAARSIDERLGGEYGRYAHQAADAVSSFAGRIRNKSVDELLDDGRSMVRASPGIAIATAAVAGFALMRVIRTGLDEVGLSGNGGNGGNGGRSGTEASSGGGA